MNYWHWEESEREKTDLSIISLPSKLPTKTDLQVFENSLLMFLCSCIVFWFKLAVIEQISHLMSIIIHTVVNVIINLLTCYSFTS